MPSRRAGDVYRGGRARPGSTSACRSRAPTTSAPAGRAPSPQDGVCNGYGQTHDVKNLFISDGSQFTTGAAENPTLTIVALAIRQAEYIADQMSKGEV